MVVGVVIALIVVAALLLVAGRLWRELRALQTGTAQAVSERTSDMHRQLGSLQESFDRRLAAMDDKVGKGLEGLDNKLLTTLRNSGETTKDIVERLGNLDKSAAQMLSRANDLAR